MTNFHQCSTFSKHPSRYPDVYPKTLRYGHGAYVGNSDGRWVDWVQGLTSTAPLGHAHPYAVDRVRAALESGQLFHLPDARESELADAILYNAPSPIKERGRVRFCTNGTDATAGAIRLARAVTNRKDVIVFRDSYHGDSTGDWAIRGKSPSRGVPMRSPVPITIDWNRADSLKILGSDLGWFAAVIFEVRGEAPTPELVETLHELRDRHGFILIADEVVTGYKLDIGGACAIWKIRPDLVCYGKSLGNGFPIACLAGREELMREFDLDHTKEPVFMSFTHGGNAIGLAAALGAIRAIPDHDAIRLAGNAGLSVMKIVDSEMSSYLRWAGQPQRFNVIETMPGFYRHLTAHLAVNGHLIGPVWAPTYLHAKKEVESLAEAMTAAKRIWAAGQRAA